MNKILRIAPLITILFFITSCKKDSEPDEEETESGTASCVLNGETFTSSGNSATLTIETDGTDISKSLSVYLFGSESSINITLLCITEDDNVDHNIPLKPYTEPSVLNSGGSAIIGDSSSLWDTSTHDDATANITLTALNSSDKTVSGTFSFSAADFSTGEINCHATDGIFTDISYTVIE